MNAQIELAEHCQTKLPREDANAFAQAVATLAADARRCARMGQAGRLHVEQRMSVSGVMSALNEQLRAVLAARLIEILFGSTTQGE